jgi:hypothetical protein
MNISKADLDNLIAKSKNQNDEEENVVCFKGHLLAFDKEKGANEEYAKRFLMTGFHKVSFKIKGNEQEVDE